MTTLSAHQPAFMPWPGYLDRIRQADVFVILTGVQFEKGSFINRNRIKTQHGEHWLTVPLVSPTLSPINEISVAKLNPWKKKHLKTIFHAYKQAPRFLRNYPKIEALYENTDPFLFGWALRSTKMFCEDYGIDAITVLYPQPVFRTLEVIQLCQEFNADTYLSGPQGRNYLDEDALKEAGIELKYHDYQMKPYPQLFGDFIPNLSVLDMWFNQEELP